MSLSWVGVVCFLFFGVSVGQFSNVYSVPVKPDQGNYAVYGTTEGASMWNATCGDTPVYGATKWYYLQNYSEGDLLAVENCNTQYSNVVLSAYLTTSDNQLECVDVRLYTCANGSQISFTAEQFGYRFAVTTDNEPGPFEFRAMVRTHEEDYIGEDDCLDSSFLKLTYYPFNFGNTLQNNADGYFQDICGLTTTNHVIWYEIEQFVLGYPITISTCSDITEFDTIISVLYGACGNLRCIGFNDDDYYCSDRPIGMSSLTVTIPGNYPFYLAISGYESSWGRFGLSISQYVPDGASCHNAINMTMTQSDYGEFISVTEFVSSSFYSSSWIAMNATVAGTFTANTCNTLTNINSTLTLYSSKLYELCERFESLNTSIPMDCPHGYGNSASQISFDMEVTTDSVYYLKIGSSVEGEKGNYQLFYRFEESQ